MKKIVALAGTMLLLAATTARADHRLLITDVLDQGHFDGTVAYEYTHTFEHPSWESSVAHFSIGAGVVKDFELAVSAPFIIYEDGGWSGITNVWGDTTITGKYRIMNEQPVTVTAGISVTLGNGRVSAGTNYAPFIAVSRNIGEETRPYAAYLPAFRGDGRPDTHSLRFGVEKQINDLVTLDGRLDASFFTGTGAHDFQAYELRLASYLQLAKNFYFIPSLGFSYLRNEYDDAWTYSIGTGLYYMF